METKSTKKEGIVKRFMSPKTEIVKHGKWYSIAPIVIITIGIAVVLLFNFNLGLDFTGGTIVKVTGLPDIETTSIYTGYVDDIKDILSENGIPASKAQFQKESNSVSGAIALTVKYQDKKGLKESEMEDLNVVIKNAIAAKLASGTVEDADRISASSSSEKLLNAFIAVAVALIGILIYVAFRFKFTSGVAGIIGLVHDVLVMMALVAIFRIQINSAFIAALITIVGYSINNTLVLFDRVREIEKDHESRQNVSQVIDRAIKETMGRTMNTTITTLVPVFVLAIIGVPLIREFAIPIIFGLIAGTYSSILLTSALYVRFETHKQYKLKYKTRPQVKLNDK